jgi:uroporphyrin-III C-methyltransferase
VTRPAGKVFLVGAGPGHPDLITVRGRDLLARADAVVFDRLVQESMLHVCRPDARRYYVGKAPGHHHSRQEEINALLVRLAGEQELVVRLKGGDPLLFGRGGEEAEALAAHGIAFEIVPGVSSALAAPAAAGIPVTHRGYACTFAVVTGHEQEGACDGRIDWSALARVDTLVVLMGVHSLPRVTQRLLEEGRAADTPAALIESASWADERTLVGTLGNIADVAHREKARPPATLVIGDVVTLRAVLDRSSGQALVAHPAAAPAERLEVPVLQSTSRPTGGLSQSSHPASMSEPNWAQR